MTNTVQIRKTSIDLDDPCGAVKELQKVRLQIAAGSLAETVRFGEDEVRFSKANISVLDREIARLEAACQATSGTPARRRYAKAIHF